jgi:hypothetical protein
MEPGVKRFAGELKSSSSGVLSGPDVPQGQAKPAKSEDRQPRPVGTRKAPVVKKYMTATEKNS